MGEVAGEELSSLGVSMLQGARESGLGCWDASAANPAWIRDTVLTCPDSENTPATGTCR